MAEILNFEETETIENMAHARGLSFEEMGHQIFEAGLVTFGAREMFLGKVSRGETQIDPSLFKVMQ
jgi:hypothetical protein